MSKIFVIGGGAAGCFCAIELAKNLSDTKICILEASGELMTKLSLTGGGRCNMTNNFEGVDVREAYPRGGNLMKRLLGRFGPERTRDWFSQRGIPSYVQKDGRIFPCSNDALLLVHKLEKELKSLGVEIIKNCRVASISADLKITTNQGVFEADKIVLTSGGGAIRMLEGLDIQIQPVVPSLFTFKIADSSLRSLMGTSVPTVSLLLAGTSFRSNGSLLVTDWGISGPAVLKLSSYAARYLAEHQYKASLCVNWCGKGEEQIRTILNNISRLNPQKQVQSTPVEGISQRLWLYLIEKAQVRPDIRWAELGSKGLSRLVAVLSSDMLEINGRAKFKEEFVSCGGVSLDSVNSKTLECKNIPGLYFAGEVLDIDAVTGGFNLQAAWTTAWVAAHSMLG